MATELTRFRVRIAVVGSFIDERSIVVSFLNWWRRDDRLSEVRPHSKTGSKENFFGKEFSYYRTTLLEVVTSHRGSLVAPSSSHYSMAVRTVRSHSLGGT